MGGVLIAIREILNAKIGSFTNFAAPTQPALVRNVDLRTAQGYLGHTRITSTERYLRAASAADGQKRVSAIDWTKPFYG